jgi:integrase
MPLTDVAIRKAKPTGKTERLFDGGGLYLEISPAGGKWWRWKYRRPITKKENRLSFGTYPEVSLADARARRDAARKLLAAGIDPGEQRKAETAAGSERAANSFEVVAREWFAKQSPTWAPSHGSRIIDRLERDLFPWIGGRPIADITAKELLATVTRIADRGAVETAHRALQNCGQVFRYAIATGRAERNPAPDLRGALPPVKPTHLAAITAPPEIGGLLRAIESYQGSFITKCALRLAPLVFVRPGELRQAEWSEMDLASAEWNIPGHKMKTREPHLVPLSPQAVAILIELHALTGRGRFVFPSPRTTTRPMSNMGIMSALRRMGYAKDEMTGHGFRAMARTVLDQELGFRVDYIEHQLAHTVRDPLGRAYNRTTHLPERRRMMTAWADYLDQLRDNTGNVLPFKRTSSGDDR